MVRSAGAARASRTMGNECKRRRLRLRPILRDARLRYATAGSQDEASVAASVVALSLVAAAQCGHSGGGTGVHGRASFKSSTTALAAM